MNSSPEARLWKAVVVQAVTDYLDAVRDYRFERSRDAISAQEFIFSPRLTKVCQYAGLDANAIRRKCRETKRLMASRPRKLKNTAAVVLWREKQALKKARAF